MSDDAHVTFKKYFCAVFLAYILLFSFVIFFLMATLLLPILSLVDNNEGENVIFVVLLALLCGLPFMASFLIGYPLFKRIINRLRFNALMNALISFISLALVVIFFVVIIYLVLNDVNIDVIPYLLMFGAVPEVIMALLSGGIFWIQCKRTTT